MNINVNTISTGVIDYKYSDILLLSNCNLSSSTGRGMEKIIGLGTFGPYIESIESYSKSIELNGPLLYPQGTFPFPITYTNSLNNTTNNQEDNQKENMDGEETNPENGEETAPVNNEQIYNCFDLYSWLVNETRNNVIYYLLGMYIDNIGLSFGDDASCSVSMSTRMPYQVPTNENPLYYDFMNFQITNDVKITSNQYVSNKLKIAYFLLKPQYFIENSDIVNQFVITNCKFNIKFEYADLKNLISGWSNPELESPYIMSYPNIPRILTGITMDAEYDFLLLKMTEIHKIPAYDIQENLIARLECPVNERNIPPRPPIDFVTIYDNITYDDYQINTINGYITSLMYKILNTFGYNSPPLKWTIRDCNLTNINPSGIPSYHLAYNSSIAFDPTKIMYIVETSPQPSTE